MARTHDTTAAPAPRFEGYDVIEIRYRRSEVFDDPGERASRGPVNLDPLPITVGLVAIGGPAHGYRFDVPIKLEQAQALRVGERVQLNLAALRARERFETVPLPPTDAPAEFRKRPVVIQALQWTGDNRHQVLEFIGEKGGHWQASVPETGDVAGMLPGAIVIYTREGNHTATAGDWIIRGIAGEFYPCKPDIFRDTYDRVEVPVARCAHGNLEHECTDEACYLATRRRP